jgi:hypothetical protein
MKPHIKNSSIRVRNKKKYNSVPRKLRRTGYKVANPTGFWDTFALGGHVIRKRIFKSKRKLPKDTFREYQIDKI